MATRITLVHTAALGDTILLMPLLRALRLQFADAWASVVMRPAFGQWLVMRGLADQWYSADDAAHTAWFAEPEGTGANSRPAWAAADLVLSAVSNGVDAWAANARRAGVGKLVTFEPRPGAEYGGHVTAWHREQLARQGLVLPEAPLPPRLANADGPVLMHPGSGGEGKCWPRESYLQLARELVRDGLQTTFLLGEAEQERWGREAIRQLQEEFPTHRQPGLGELSENMARARLYVGNDSGVTHMAAALGVPTIALFGPSDVVQWRPVGPAVVVVQAPEPGRMASLEMARVRAALLREVAG